MLPKSPRHIFYVILLIILSVVFTSAIANTNYDVFARISTVIKHTVANEDSSSESGEVNQIQSLEASKSNSINSNGNAAASMFMTIIQGADEEVGCPNDGSTIARFNLCGNSDDRIISLAGGPFSSVSWEILGGSCSPNINQDCPETNTSCYTQVSTSQNFTIDASTVPSTIGAEFRVRVNGSGPYYYFKIKKSSITQTYVKQDFICSVPGRIQITNLSSAYEFSMDNGSGFGPWQGPIFDNLTPGTYNVLARLQNTPDACEYPYEPITINQLDMAIDVTFTDAQCFGQTGTITVTPTPGIGPYKYTLLDNSGVAQEFTAFISDNPYTFSAVGFGTYIVQVETQQCTGDPLNGIDPPRENLDTGGNPIVIGSGLSPLDASTEVNSSFGCSTITDVDITVNTSGGSAPYTFTVNGGPTQPSYSGTTTYTVTSSGTYDFLITDSNGCTITASSNVEDLLPPDVTVNGIDGSCSNGGAKINFNIIDARGYNLSYRANAIDPWVTTPQISVPAGTYNNIEVRYQQSGFECTINLPPVTVTNVGAITGSAIKVADRTCDGSGGTNGGQIDFVGPFSGGSGSGYVFSIDGLNFTAVTTYPNLSPGTYTPMIEDGGGCRLELTPITILDVDPPTDIDFAQSNINCAAGTSDVTLTPTANAAIIRYEVISPTPGFDNDGDNTNAIITGLSTNISYIFQITDANNCIYTESFTPAQISSIRARVKSGGDLKVCNGAADGSGTFLIDGFANNYTWDINGGLYSGGPQGSSEVVLPPSGAGTYTIIVTDADTGCTDTTSFDIQEAAVLDLSTSAVTPMSCSNNNRGRVVANTTGGWGNNKYTLTYPGGSTTVGPKTGRTFSNLSVPSTPGNPYILTVEDSEGCTDTFTFDLTPLDAPVISLEPSILCYVPGTGATINVSATGGTAGPPYEYRINSGSWQATPSFASLNPGSYSVQVRDGNNCRDNINVTVNPQLRVLISPDFDIPCGGAPGQLSVQVTGGYTSGAGTKQYEVYWNGALISTQPLTTNNFTYPVPLGAHGTYRFDVLDNEGCTATSNDLIMQEPMNISATHQLLPASCGQTNNGSIIISPVASSGEPPFFVAFAPTGTLTTDGFGNVTGPFSPQTVYSSLNAGQVYDYVVRDARGCDTGIITVTIPLDGTPNPDATVAEIPATCSAGVVTGGIQISGVTDGTPNFSFRVEDTFGNTLVQVNDVAPASLPLNINDPSLVPGNYTIITLDANGCRDVDTVTITTPDVVITPINFTPAITCDDTGFTYTVQVTPTIFPTLPTYQIRIAGQASFYALDNITGPDEHTFSNSADGIQYGVAYTVEVLAPNGCIYEQEIPPIDGFSDIEITATTGSAFCDDFGNGSADFTVVDFLGPDLTIEIIDQATNTVLATDLPTGLTGGIGSSYSGSFAIPPGSYRILVTDSDGCTDAVNVDVILNAPSVDVLRNVPANCNALGQLTFQGSGGTPFALPASPYLYAVVPFGSPVDEDGTLTPADPSDDFSDQTTVLLPGSLAGINYSIWVLDSRGCTFDVTQEVVQLQPNLPAPNVVVDNQCVVTATTFQITVSMPASVDSPAFTLGGDTQFGVLNIPLNVYEANFTVGSPGVYTVDVIDVNGCTGQGPANVYEFLSASVAFSTDPTCIASDGVLTVTTNGGSGTFDFELQDGGGTYIDNNATGVFSGYGSGSYQVLVTDTETACTATDNIDLIAAVPPVITVEIPRDISCFNFNDGSLDIILDPLTAIDTPIEFILYNLDSGLEVTRNNSGSFANLSEANYQVEVLTARGCSVLSATHFIDNPDDFVITASAPDFTCEPGANRFSSTTITAVVDPANPGTALGGYQYSITGFSNYQSSNTFEIVDDGSIQNITVYAIDGNGCETTSNPIIINPPTGVVPTITDSEALTCATAERVEISVTGTANFEVSVTPAVPGSPFGNGGAGGPANVLLPAAGDYLLTVHDLTGCDYPLPKYTVNEPIEPIVFISEAKPVTCFVPGNDGEMFIEVSDYTGIYTYNVYSNSDPTKTTVLATGSFDTNNFPDVNGDPARITGLTGGNFFVEVISAANPFCSGDSNVATIRTPNGSLQVDAIEIGNTGCNDDTGKIEATGQGGWDSSPYEYRLLLSADGGVTYPTEVVAFSNVNVFENLPNGDYQIEIRDVEGCTDTFDINLPPVVAIDAGIREPLSLQCPGGNNAVLETYDPTSGDATTAISGASGGYPGAGYNYRLLYLNSNDNTDIASASGLQNSPTFIGASGGFISEGWYAIEVSSSFDCLFVTIPYYVDPPPPVAPRLVQTRVPGCGGMGEIRLTIENPDPAFTYEYLRVENGVTVGVYTDLVGTSELFPGNAGITYQFDVRKKNASNTCMPVRSNGITMTDASGITLLPNQPDDISCSSELDGRIESFINGGVGDNLFYLYAGDPVDAFSPSGSATLVRGPQDNGTFEGLPEGATYYIAVTSGINCSDIAGPFEIIRPEPIVFNATPTPVSCNREEDGSISIEVISGGVGLLQFAIEPHFNEFFSDPANPGTYTFEDLAEGSYEILIQDENGCFEKEILTITEPDELIISDVTTTPETCIGFENGTAQLTVIGGTPFVDPITFVPYYETMLVGPNSDGSEIFVRNDNLFFDNLIGGEAYIVFVQDANLCGTDDLIPIEIGVDITAEAIVQYGCEGIFPNSTVNIEMQDTSLLPSLLFSLDVDDINLADTQTTWGDLPAGDHTVYIYHENGCASFEDFTIVGYDPLTLSAVKTGPNELTATASGGFGGYEYFFQGESYGSDTVFTTNESITVNVRVVDQNGCVAEVAVPFEFTGMIEIPNFFTPDGDNNNDVWAPKNRDFFPNIEVKIYDRYGRVVAILDQVANWDGNYDGSPVPSGDYWYVVNANDKSKMRYVGHFTLYR